MTLSFFPFFSLLLLLLIYLSQRIFSQEKRLTGSVTRTMAAMSLGFIVMVTPWTIQEVVAACTGSKVIYLFYFSLYFQVFNVRENIIINNN